jgi:uncharacterized damage-inducible protein DinB
MDATTTALLDSLEIQRAHVLGCLEGLEEVALRTPVLPTNWSCLGLVQHLTLDVERFWFTVVVDGQAIDEPAEPRSAWVVDPETTAAAVFERYRLEIERANAVIMATPLEAEPKAWPDFFGEFRLRNLRAVLLHVITETACHAGHLDAARELIDGGTWVILE